MPEVSVIVPNYNYEKYLQIHLESILNQSFQDFEVIILDDKSTDGSKYIIEKYRNHPKVKHIVYNNLNSGSPFIQWKKGLELASGEWIWVAEADDLSNEHFLEKLLANAQKDKEIVLSYCQSFKMDSEGNTTGNWNDWTKDLDETFFNNNFIIEGTEYIEKFLINKNTIPNASGVIFRKDAYLKVGKIDETVKFCSDWLLWLKLLMTGKVAFCNEKLNYFRYHNKSVIATASINDKIIFIYKYDIILRKKFLEFLCKKDQDFTNSIQNKLELIKNFKVKLSVECELEAKLLKTSGLKKQSITYMFNSLKYTNNKKILFYRLVFRYLLS